LWNFAIEGITSFSIVPLKIATYIGLTTAVTAFVYGFIVIYKTLVYGDPVAGFPALMVVITFLGGVQLMSLGIIGEYLGRMFDETKRRPLYLVNRYSPARMGEQPLEDKAGEIIAQPGP
jgi:glycosyltransferase involved in cell wall biosynthesis